MKDGCAVLFYIEYNLISSPGCYIYIGHNVETQYNVRIVMYMHLEKRKERN